MNPDSGDRMQDPEDAVWRIREWMTRSEAMSLPLEELRAQLEREGVDVDAAIDRLVGRCSDMPMAAGTGGASGAETEDADSDRRCADQGRDPDSEDGGKTPQTEDE
ncbi:MAG: hypothetical protein CMJ83_20680 [Planctomycetes bacterium]|nr:hypothetical protein [Planctomycetota bacterium]